MFVSIAGIRYGKICFDLAQYNFNPFGREAMDKGEFYGNEVFRIDCRNLLYRQFWFFIAGWWLALGHFVFAILNFITIAGMPAARRHFNLMCVSLNPIGQIIVDVKDAAKAKRRNALRRIQKLKKELSVKE